MSLADLLLTTLKKKVESLELVPGTGGCFEVSVDGDLLYSKLKTGKFPEDQDVLRDVQARAR